MSSHPGPDDNQGYGVHFFKVILESNIRDGELRVPRSFVKRHWQGMSKPILLRLPNGNEWEIYWMERDGDVWFRNGWKEFAEYCSLDVSQFLVFRYDRESHFKVTIFGKNGLEIKYPLPRSTDKEGNKVYESDCSLEIVDRKRPKSPSPSSQIRKKMKTSSRKEPESYPSRAETKRTKKKAHSGYSKSIEDKSKEFHDKVKNEFRSENDFFICSMKKTYTERDVLVIPNEFSKPHLHMKEGSATLYVNKERTWDVRLKLCSNNRQLTFTRGWRKFFEENYLKFGDVCAFELNYCKGVSFKVVIFRWGEDSSTCLFEAQEELYNRPSSSLRNFETPKAKSRFLPKNYFIFYFRHNTPSYFATIPIDFIKNYITHNGQYVTLRIGNKFWVVKVLYYPYNYSAKFSQGWHEFVRDCNLKEGDSCRFEMIDEEKLVFEVSLSIQIR